MPIPHRLNVHNTHAKVTIVFNAVVLKYKTQILHSDAHYIHLILGN